MVAVLTLKNCCNGVELLVFPAVLNDPGEGIAGDVEESYETVVIEVFFDECSHNPKLFVTDSSTKYSNLSVVFNLIFHSNFWVMSSSIVFGGVMESLVIFLVLVMAFKGEGLVKPTKRGASMICL